MRPIKEKKPKRHYAVLLHGRHYADTWAVSPRKAIANVWWKFEKNENEFTSANYTVDDFDAVEI